VLPSHPLHDLPAARWAERHLNAVWLAVDETVGRLAELVGDETMFVLYAVHGMRTNGADTANVLLPELVHRSFFGEPFLEFEPFDPAAPPLLLDEPGTLAFDYLLDRTTSPRGSMGASRRAQVRARLVWEVRRRAPEQVRAGLERMVRARQRGSDVPWWEMRARLPASETIDPNPPLTELCDFPAPAWWSADWRRVPWFVIPSFSDVHVRVNLEGRERHGVVPGAGYERALDAAEAFLRAVTDARTGQPVVGEMHRMRTADPYARYGPSADLVVTVPHAADTMRHPDVGVVGPVPFFRAGEHSNQGWVAIPSADGSRHTGPEGRPCDVSATILDLLGRGPSPLVTGQSLQLTAVRQ
jgi:hypothetical protein